MSIVRSANARVPGGPTTCSGIGIGGMTHCVVTRSLKSVTWSECRWVNSTECRKIGAGTPAAARRMATPRPQSTSRLSPPACTSVAGPARLALGNGEPVPSMVTIICVPPSRSGPRTISSCTPGAYTVAGIRRGCNWNAFYPTALQ